MPLRLGLILVLTAACAVVGAFTAASAGAQQPPFCGPPLLPPCEEPPPPPPPPPPPVRVGDCDFRRAPVQGDKRAASPAAPNPLAGEQWYVDTFRKQTGNKAYREPAFGEYVGSTGARRELMGRIALTPRFTWFGKFTPVPERICAYILTAEAAGQVPLITTLRHQGKACNPRYQAGGVAEDNRTKAWFRDLARGIGDSRVVIAYEPDSTGTIECLARSRRKARIKLLRYGIDVLSQLPNATIYIEATASDWKPARLVARRLRAIGINKVRGFLLNVTHFDWTAANIRYGAAISRRVGGKHFIINTSANGRGPVHFFRRIGRRNRRITVNCHPLHRGLGPQPTTDTGSSLVDAFMWVSRPGYSSGRCNGGPRREGDWWPARALDLARNQTNWRSPPRGTKFGWPRGKYSAREVAGDQYRR